ncbi:MAG TPA: porin family protein [Allosphingosinicella sp.]|jgi:outer membrane immunogenic protein|nr:porin family protein [Allosphingosinicella sp.]
MRIIFAAALLAAASATPAFAQDAAPAFSGGHIEAIGGYDSISGGGDSQSGLAYGIAGGYDFRSGNTVFGIELEAAESTTEDSGVEAGRDLYAGARIGAVVSPTVLVYAKAGYTNARATVSGLGGANFDGIRAGAGVEILLGSNFSIRGEYRYSNYEDDLSRNQGVIGLGFRF